MNDTSLETEEMKKEPEQPGTEDDARASIVFALLQLNRATGDVPYENRKDFLEVIKNADFSTWPAGATIIEQGTPGDRLYVILEGSAVDMPPDCAPSVLEKGARIGKMQLLNNEQFSSPVAAGTAGASLLIIKKETLLANPVVYRSLLDQGLLIQGRDCAYVLGEKLGEGATGHVFEIEGHTLCAKIFRPRPDAAAGAPVSIPEEILRLRHPNIVSIHENISAHGAQFIIMDLAKGLTIRRKNGGPARCHNVRQMMEAFQSEQQRVSLDMTAKVFRHVAAALLHIHEQGFVHRDVKPEHIFIDVNENDISFMLSDFSLAFPISTRPGKIEGTPHYCPPEAISIEKPETLIAGSADFYSLAAVCFELLTGQTVFSCSNVLELAQQHLQAEPDLTVLPSETPIWLGKFIEQALKKNPDERPTREEIEKLITGA
ncbi:MAG: protein kinase [Deltaproteobacteria bacterium]|nr:protein kinase [Deltaproteobacteria bacterium]